MKIDKENMKILHIISYPRSGSTILGLACAQYKEAVYLGEVSDLFRWTWNRHCGCTSHQGTHLSQCTVWGPILRKAQTVFERYGFWDEEKACFKRSVQPLFLKKALKQLKSGKPGPELKATLEILNIVFEESARIEKAKVVVDSSKDMYYLQILNHCYQEKLFSLHLLRDPRGVVFSARKNPTIPGKETPLSLWRSARIATGWAIKNSIIKNYLKQSMANRDSEKLLYKDWCETPRLITDSLMKRLLETNVLETPFTDETTLKVELTHSHAFSGNRSKGSSGLIAIQRDQSWEKSLKKPYQFTAKIMSFPVLNSYGFGRVKSL